MNKLNKIFAVALVSGMTMFGANVASYADEDVKAACTQLAEDDGYTGEEKAAAIKECMEQAASAGNEGSENK